MVSSNGIEMGSQTDMLRLDALIMTVQLNLRKLLEVTHALLATPISLDTQSCHYDKMCTGHSIASAKYVCTA